MKGFAAVLVFLAACVPDVPSSPGPSPRVVVLFNPAAAVVPAPNDLAIDLKSGKVVVPPSPTDSPAQTEFNQSYLGTLSGFPYESTATVALSGALNPSTVSAASVIGIDLTIGKTNPLGSLLTLAPAYDPAANVISIPPPKGAWTRGHQYAIALLAGPNGLSGANGEPVIGSETWELISSPNPLVDCPNGDLTSPSCALLVDIIPSTLTDPGARLADQLQKALQLEQIRLAYAPILAQLEASTGLPREQIPILWTFTIVDAGEVTFDPANSVIPFPNDVALSNGKVALPNPKTGKPLTATDCMTTDATIALYCGLNTLDGFSTLAPPISENSLTAGAVAQANIDGKTLGALTVGLAPVKSTAPMAEQTTPMFEPCLNCLSSVDANGKPQTSPQQLQWKLDAPLDEKTTYLAWVTGDVKDDQGKGVVANPIFALVRLANPLIDANGHATVNILTDAQAAQLEPLRVALKPAIDGLAAKGLPRTNLTLAWAFTTQSEATILDQLRAYPSMVPMLPDFPLYVYDATVEYQTLAAQAGLTDVAANIGTMLVGEFITPVAVTGPGGTLNPAAPVPKAELFAMAIPKAAAPPTGYPVTILGHGLTRSRQDFLAIAGALADPALGPLAMVTIATDALFHGDRSSCTGAASALGQMTDDAACAEPTTQKCDEDPLIGRCIARDPTTRIACTPGAAGDQACGVAGQGACQISGVCEGGDFLRDNYSALKGTAPALIPFQRPVISGWNAVNANNFFGTRDNFRQQVIDLAQLVRLLESTASTNLTAQASLAAGGPVTLDTTKVGYLGVSLGGILGTLYNAVSPEVINVALDVPGGAIPQILLNAPSFAPEKMALLQTLAAQGINVGTPAFDQFFGIAQWVLDPADPANMGWRLTHPVDLGSGLTAPNANRKAFIQFIEGDQTVPNISSFALVTGANRTFTPTPPSFGCMAPLFCYEFTEAGDGFDTTTAPLAKRHPFFLVPPSATPTGIGLTTKAQTQVTTFLALGHLP